MSRFDFPKTMPRAVPAARRIDKQDYPESAGERLDSEAGTRGLLTERQGKLLFITWLLLLLPWIVIAPFVALGFDGPRTLSIYLAAWSIWSYPASVGVVWIFRKKNPVASLFPCLNFVVFTVALFVRP